MALQKTISTNFGVDGNYLKLTEVFIDLMKQYALVKLAIFKDQAARDAGKIPLEVKAFDISADNGIFPLLADQLEAQGVNVYQAIYAYIKSLPDYSDASDV